MHVAVRKRVGDHPEWDHEKWGLPISQTYMMLTQIGGSVAPALALWLLGYQTTAREMRALLHFNRYMGHLLGVQPQWMPETVRECLQVLALATAARSYDSGDHGKELIESFPEAFAPREGQTGLTRVRAAYNYRIYSAYCALWMNPATRRQYDMPPAFPWILILVARFPLVTVTELLRRLPGLRQLHNKAMVAHRLSWWKAQMAGREAEFDASSALRR
jgi:ER-bound oxygenase mpaB/B'/Rubber oxygenase, catalytic domain